MKFKELVFLCGARDFHAMDWYKSAKELLQDRDIFILTDLIQGEGYRMLINKNDKVFKLFIIDKFLVKRQSSFGHIWRNIVKLVIFPIQVILIKRFSRRHPSAIYHAHSMYYLFLAYASGIPYVGTPQGSDILIKPFKSKVYRHFTKKSLKRARSITVDSKIMSEKIFELTGLKAHVIQNGIDLESINLLQKRIQNDKLNRKNIISIRGITPLYRIKEIIEARNSTLKLSNTSITFLYPFYDDEYLKKTTLLLKPFDINLGRVERFEMYELLVGTKLVISIPYSDSSPRSVYEAVFCGSAVAITLHPYYAELPQCMKSRIVIVDLKNKDWLKDAIEKAENIIQEHYFPSEEALNIFDQKKSFGIMAEQIFS